MVAPSMRNEIATQEVQKIDASNAESDLESLQLQVLQLNKNIGRSDMEPDQVQQEILGVITQFSQENQVRVERLEATHTFETVDFNIYSNQVAVKGTYNGILSLVYYMENEFDYARLTNIAVYKEEDTKSKQTGLYASLLFQHYRQKNGY